MFLLSDILFYGVVAAIVVAAVSYMLLRWSRQYYRFLVSSLTTFLGFTAWNIVQSSTGADRALNIDWPIFPLSWADVGSGILAFFVSAIVLGLVTEREQPSQQVVTAAGVAGVLAILVDLFVL